MFKDQFNYSILGSENHEKVVFIHGLMAFSANWRKIATRLQDQYQCLIYDQRGHGRSFKPETGYTPEIFANDLNIITNELGWTKFHLVGHSMGGRNALVFAHLFPDKLRSLVIEDIGPEKDASAVHYYKDLLERIPTPFESKEKVREFFSINFLKDFSPKEPPDVLSTFLQANLEEKSNGMYDWRFSKQAVYEIVEEGHQKDRWIELSSLKIPTLIIRGEKSHILKAETYEKMLLINPLIEGRVFSKVGHWIHFEKYQEFVDELIRFFKDK